jgi:hypothetical protein
MKIHTYTHNHTCHIPHTILPTFLKLEKNGTGLRRRRKKKKDECREGRSVRRYTLFLNYRLAELSSDLDSSDQSNYSIIACLLACHHYEFIVRIPPPSTNIGWVSGPVHGMWSQHIFK